MNPLGSSSPRVMAKVPESVSSSVLTRIGTPACATAGSFGGAGVVVTGAVVFTTEVVAKKVVWVSEVEGADVVSDWDEVVRVDELEDCGEG